MKTLLLFIATALMGLCQSPLFAQCTQNDWAVYLGGTAYDYVEEVAVDISGNAIITGKTKSTSGVATPGAYQTKYGGGGADAFVSKFDPAGTLLWSTYLGGKNWTTPTQILLISMAIFISVEGPKALPA